VPAKNILIFTAVWAETRAIHKALRGSACRVRAIGIGAGHLPSVDEIADASVIVMCGLAGGLDPALAIGEILLDDPNGIVPLTILIRRGTIHTSKQIISSPAQKAELFRQTGALAVDMEQSIVRDFASRLGIPVIGVRAISDTADEILDPAVVHLVDDLGRVRPGKIAAALIRRPGLIPYLRKLNENTNIALHELGKAVQSIAEYLEGT
jgi:hypothetical protein